MYCRKCGKQIVEGGKFCGSCGTSVLVLNTQTPQPIPIQEEIIEIEETKLESLEKDSTVIGIVAGTIVIGILMIIGIGLL